MNTLPLKVVWKRQRNNKRNKKTAAIFTFSFVGLGLVGWHKLGFEGTDTLRFVPFLETNFPALFQDSDWFSRTLKFKFFFHSQNHNVNSPYCPPYISYFLLEVNIFIELSRISSLFPRLSSPGKCPNKIPEFSRTHTNPVANSAHVDWWYHHTA